MNFDIPLDRNGGPPLYRQIARALSRQIDEESLPAGLKLPSSRDLAARLQVNRTTVTAAYRELKKRGYVASGVGQGTFVRTGRPIPSLRTRSTPTRFPWAGVSDWETIGLRTRPRARLGPEAIVLDRALPDPALHPRQALADFLQKVIRRNDGSLFSYGPPEGDEGLRASLKERLGRVGIDFEENDLLIVGGSQQGLDLVGRLLLRGGGVVVVDAPTYRGAMDVFQASGADLVGVPTHDAGTDLDALEALVDRRRPRFIYAMPTFHNPTGISLNREARQRLYDIANRAQVPILEDDWLGELRTADDPPPVKAYDRSGIVLHCGTFSKTAVPGLRVGWLVVPKAIFGAMVHLKSHCDLSTGLIGQRALDAFIRSDLYGPHIQHVRETYGERILRAREALQRHLPDVRTTRPEGGLVQWLELPAGLDGWEITRALEERSVLVAPGELFQPRGIEGSGLRLCYSLATPEQIEVGIERLAEVVNEFLRRARRTGTAATPLV